MSIFLKPIFGLPTSTWKGIGLACGALVVPPALGRRAVLAAVGLPAEVELALDVAGADRVEEVRRLRVVVLVGEQVVGGVATDRQVDDARALAALRRPHRDLRRLHQDVDAAAGGESELRAVAVAVLRR